MRANAIGFSWFYLHRRLRASYLFVPPPTAATADVCYFSFPLVPEYTQADETFTTMKKGERKAFPLLDGALAALLSWHCRYRLCTLYYAPTALTHACSVSLNSVRCSLMRSHYCWITDSFTCNRKSSFCTITKPPLTALRFTLHHYAYNVCLLFSLIRSLLHL